MDKFLSLCMIVKNEEKVLERCLNSVAKVVDEIIIVDTGSTDKTKQIARKYTTKIYDYEWVNNFSLARNFAASKAEGKWILVLDADEYVYEENLKDAINQLKENMDTYDTYSPRIFNFSGWNGQLTTHHYHERIYKNNGQILYNRPIHEQLVVKSGDKKHEISNLIIYHSGYMPQTFNEKNKSDRNTKILEEEIKCSKNPAFDYFNLGNEYVALKEYEKALESYKKAFNLKEDISLAWVSYTTIQIIYVLVTLNRLDDALKVTNDGILIWDKSPEFKFLKAYIYFLQFRYDDAIVELVYLIENTDEFNNVILSQDYVYSNPYELLGRIKEVNENYDEAIKNYSKVLQYNQNKSEILARILFILNKFHSEEEIYEYILKNNFIRNEQDQFLLCDILIGISMPSIAKRILDKGNNSSLKRIALLLRINIALNDLKKLREIMNTIKVNEFFMIINKGYLDIYDIVILKFMFSNLSFNIAISNEHPEKETISYFIDFIDDKNDGEKIDSQYILNLIEKCIQYRAFDLFEEIILKKSIVENPDLCVNIGNLIFSYGFKEMAIEMYHFNNNVSDFDNQAIINITKSFVEKGLYKEALEFATVGMLKENIDFRIIKYIIEIYNLDSKYNKNKIDFMKYSLEQYPDSEYLKDMFLFA